MQKKSSMRNRDNSKSSGAVCTDSNSEIRAHSASLVDIPDAANVENSQITSRWKKSYLLNI